jgi:hypothetical protein
MTLGTRGVPDGHTWARTVDDRLDRLTAGKTSVGGAGATTSAIAAALGDLQTQLGDLLNGVIPASLGQLNDVDYTNQGTQDGPTTNQILTWAATTDPETGATLTGTWVPATPTPPVTTLAGQTDVAITSPTNGQVLTYDTASGKWKNATPTAAVTSVAGKTGAVTLVADDLTDVTVATPTTGQILTYNGTTWVNSATITGALTITGNIATNGTIKSQGAAFAAVARTTSGTAGTAYTGTRTGAADEAGITFIAPASGTVILLWHVGQSSAASFALTSFEVRVGATIGSGTVFLAADDNRQIQVQSTSEISGASFYPITGLTPGTTYNARPMYRVGSGTATFNRPRIAAIPALG